MTYRLIERGDVGSPKLLRMVCMRCSRIEEHLCREGDVRPTCAHCDFPLELTLAMPRLQFFHAGFYEHISENGAYISSMDQLAREANANGNTSQYERDTSLHYDRPKREI